MGLKGSFKWVLSEVEDGLKQKFTKGGSFQGRIDGNEVEGDYLLDCGKVFLSLKEDKRGNLEGND